jgi:serine/threonine protein phosphatase PrpC
MLSNDEIQEELRSGKSFEVIMKDLVEDANIKGGEDNITVVVVDPEL